MAAIFTAGKFQAIGPTGIVPGARLYTYAATTLTPLATFTDQGGGSSNANPVVCDANGQASVWLGSSAYRMILKNASDVVIWDTDNIVPPGSAVAASTVTFAQPGAGAVTRTVEKKLQETASVLDYIPVSEHAAIAAYTSTLDVTDYFNAALAAHAVVTVPAGGYLTTRPINMSARRSASGYWGRKLVGDGLAKTIINAYTGVYPCIDCTGMNDGEVSGINFRSDNPPSGFSAANCASIGLMQGRGVNSQSSNHLLLKDLRFNMTSDIARNGGIGTVGICNNGSEHVLRDACEIYANLPLVDHNGLQFTVANSSDIPTYGTQYEPPIASPISCTIHENRNLILVSYDSFRAWWGAQVAHVEFPVLYTSTRHLVGGAPAYAETFYITGSSANLKIHCYQETSGLFGATYRMDHRYITFGGGPYWNLDINIARGVSDTSFPLPGSPVASIHLPDTCNIVHARFNCNYLPGIYDASGDTNGFANLPVTFAGTPQIKHVEFILDHGGSHSEDIFSAIGTYCTNVKSVNYLTGVELVQP